MNGRVHSRIFVGIKCLPGRALLCLAVALLLAMTPGASSAGNAEESVVDHDYVFAFDEDGYSGEWVSVEALGIEFCLPEELSEKEPPEGCAFAAEDESGTICLRIRLEAGDVADIDAWAERNLSVYGWEDANFYRALVTTGDQEVTVRILLGGGRLAAFEFIASDPDDPFVNSALQIVGSVSEDWLS